MFYPIRNCVGCGHCCLTAICVIGQLEFNVNCKSKCPGLIWNGNRYICKLANKYKRQLAIGAGCCQPLNNWRSHIKERSN